jgi:hypothetical protein
VIPPSATYSQDFYRFHWHELGIEAIAERFNDRRDDIACELTVNLDHPLYGGRLYSGRLLLIGPNSRRDVRRELEDRTGGHNGDQPFDWGGILEQLCLLARERFRQGEPVVDLALVDVGERPRFLLEPFVLSSGIAIPYGDGKTVKSIFALRWCVELALQGVKSLYLDWEDDKETHGERLTAICVGMDVGEPPPGWIFYQRRSSKLAESVNEVRQFIAKNEIGHVVIDSCGMAAGDPMDPGLVIECARAARTLGPPVSLIHHLPKDQKDKTKPFGSVYASNEARLTWLFEKAQEEGKDQLDLLLTNHAFNRGQKMPKRGYRVRFTNDGDTLVSIEFEDLSVEQMPAFKSPAGKQKDNIMAALLANGALSPADISDVLAADGVEIAPKTISAVLKRYENKFFVRRDRGLCAALASYQQANQQGAI